MSPRGGPKVTALSRLAAGLERRPSLGGRCGGAKAAVHREARCAKLGDRCTGGDRPQETFSSSTMGAT
eukprot:7324584-Pyramimonas_sp.AAC.1